MSVHTGFYIRRRADGSIDTQYYAERAERLHNASFAAIAKRVARRVARRIGNPAWQAPCAFWLASRRTGSVQR